MHAAGSWPNADGDLMEFEDFVGMLPAQYQRIEGYEKKSEQGRIVVFLDGSGEVSAKSGAAEWLGQTFDNNWHKYVDWHDDLVFLNGKRISDRFSRLGGWNILDDSQLGNTYLCFSKRSDAYQREKLERTRKQAAFEAGQAGQAGARPGYAAMQRNPSFSFVQGGFLGNNQKIINNTVAQLQGYDPAKRAKVMRGFQAYMPQAYDQLLQYLAQSGGGSRFPMREGKEVKIKIRKKNE